MNINNISNDDNIIKNSLKNNDIDHYFKESKTILGGAIAFFNSDNNFLLDTKDLIDKLKTSIDTLEKAKEYFLNSLKKYENILNRIDEDRYKDLNIVNQSYNKILNSINLNMQHATFRLQILEKSVLYDQEYLNTVKKIIDVIELNSKKNDSDDKEYYTNELIEDAIENNDISLIQDAIGTICYTDRSFEDGRFLAAIHYVVDKKKIDIMQEFDGNKLISKTKTEYTDKDFGEAVFYLKENFSKERIQDVMTIGKKLYGNK